MSLLETYETHDIDDKHKIEVKRPYRFVIITDTKTKTDPDKRYGILKDLDLDEEQVFFLDHKRFTKKTNYDVLAAEVVELNPLCVLCIKPIKSENLSLAVLKIDPEFLSDQDEEEYTRKIIEQDDHDAYKHVIEYYALTDFPHLHLHDDYSLRDGLRTLKDRVKLTLDRRYTYVTATNHGSLGGWAGQYAACQKYGLKNVFGLELYLNELRDWSKEDVKDADNETKLKYRKNNHMTIHAKTYEGYFNLIQLQNDAQQNGFYYKPRANIESIKKFGKGLIGTSGDGGAGIIPQILMDESLSEDERFEKAKEWYDRFDDALDGFYIELNLLKWENQNEINNRCIEFAKKVGAPFIVTADCHYLYPDDHETHDILLMIRDRKTVVDKAMSFSAAALARDLKKAGLATDPKSVEWDKEECERLPIAREALEVGREFLQEQGLTVALEEFEKRVKEVEKGKSFLDPGDEDSVWEFNVKDLWFKDFSALYDTWHDLHGENDPIYTEDVFWESLRYTREYVRSIDNFSVDTSVKLPIYEDADNILEKMSYEGLERLGFHEDQEYLNRMKHELEIIKSTGFSTYFLILAEIMQFCGIENVDEEYCKKEGLRPELIHEGKYGFGPGRGSCGGSLVSYAIAISQIDPIKYGLLFERFLEEGRYVPGVVGCTFEL